MKPGDVVTCVDCGATSAPAHTTGGRAFEEGGAVIVSWTNGPWPRHGTAHATPARCGWCEDKAQGIPPPTLERVNAAAGQVDPFFGTVRYQMKAPAAAPVALAEVSPALSKIAELAREYHAETGQWPPGKGVAPGVEVPATDEALHRWQAWLQQRKVAAAAAAPDAPTTRRGQMELF